MEDSLMIRKMMKNLLGESYTENNGKLAIVNFGIILIMFIGRLGAVTLLSMWIDHPEPRAHFTEETVSIG